MMRIRKRLACWTRDSEMSIDLNEQERAMTYNGLENCILDSNSYDNGSGMSRGEGFVTDSLDEDDTSCLSSNNASGSISSLWTTMKDNQCQLDWNLCTSPPSSYAKEQRDCTIEFSEVETMKQKFSKLLLGEDITGGAKGVSTAVALSRAITSLAASVFGELWKLEPLSEDRKKLWHKEMDWLLCPADYMIELVPAKQKGINCRMLEVMTPKARADVHMNLSALRKLDSILVETLDSMVHTEFWYSENGCGEEGRSKSSEQTKTCWLPSLRVPKVGLSDPERKRLLQHGDLVFQVFKAAKTINENVLLEMPVPNIIKEALPKSGKASLGDELYKILDADLITREEMIDRLKLKSEHGALEAMNRLEAAIFTWKEKITDQSKSKSSARTAWPFMKDPLSELDKVDSFVNKAEGLLHQLKTKYPNLPQTFLNVTKIQYGRDVGRSILEAYSHVLASLAFSILTRIGDILQEDVTSNPNSPLAMAHLIGARIPGVSDGPMLDRVRCSHIHQINSCDGKSSGSHEIAAASNVLPQCGGAIISSANATPSQRRVWCIGKEACQSDSAQNSP